MLPNFSTKFQHHNFQQRRVDDNSHDNILVSFVPNVSTTYVRTATLRHYGGAKPDTEQQQPQIQKTALKYRYARITYTRPVVLTVTPSVTEDQTLEK